MYSKIDFDTQKFQLGSLCKRKHKYQNLNYSLRRKCNGWCVDCQRIYNYDRAIDRPLKHKKTQKKYYQKNKERILAQQKEYKKRKNEQQQASNLSNS